MEAIAPDALVPELSRKRKALGKLRRCPMERGIKADNLRYGRELLHHRLDHRQFARQVQRRQRNQSTQLCKDAGINPLRFHETPPAVDDAVPDAGWSGNSLRRERRESPRSSVAMGGDATGFLDPLAPWVLHPTAALAFADALDGAPRQERLAGSHLVERELQR